MISRVSNPESPIDPDRVDSLQMQLSRIGASLPKELEDRYRVALMRLMQSGSRVDLILEAHRIVQGLQQVGQDEFEATSTPQNVLFKSPGMSGTVHRVRSNRRRRR